MEDGPQILPPPPSIDPISRPSSTSTSASASLTQLPGISSLGPNNGASAESPQLRATNAPAAPTYTGASPAATSGGSGNSLPTCQNCQTSTTPLWRRDEFGAVLCNACGLFLKLHGRPRPISLKTDVIKSRNRVKTMRPDLAPKKKQQQQQAAQNFGVGDPNADHNVAVAAAAAAARRTSQKSLNGNHDGIDSPISRTGTPSMYNQSLPSFIVDDPYQSGFGTTDGRAASPITGDRNMDAPQTHEQLIAHNSSLKTRVNELELINELIRGRLGQLEQQEASRGQEPNGIEQAQLRSQIDILQEKEAHLSAQLDDSHRRENSLKRRLDELELELKEAETAREAATKELNELKNVGGDFTEAKDVEEDLKELETVTQANEEETELEPPAKKARLEEPIEDEQVSYPSPSVEVS
ncbi:GATA type zinc finger protein asd-4 [Paramyrothecium foliicola]|nr:GATA type zinc finger protein asd-4 [Paramyrothecium foliicola]